MQGLSGSFAASGEVCFTTTVSSFSPVAGGDAGGFSASTCVLYHSLSVSMEGRSLGLRLSMELRGKREGLRWRIHKMPPNLSFSVIAVPQTVRSLVPHLTARCKSSENLDGSLRHLPALIFTDSWRSLGALNGGLSAANS